MTGKSLVQDKIFYLGTTCVILNMGAWWCGCVVFDIAISPFPLFESENAFIFCE